MLIRVVFPTLLVFIPSLMMVLAEPEKYAKPFLYFLFFFLVVVAFFHSYFLQHRPYLKTKYENDDFIVQSFFKGILHFIKTLSPKFGNIEIAKLPYRINIMKRKFNLNPFNREPFCKTCLKIHHHCNMEGRPDAGIILHPGRGVAGKAFKENRPKIGDTTLMAQPGADDWNLTENEKAVTKDIKSVISFPIRHDQDKNKVIGVLNIDSTENLADTPFQKSDFRTEVEQITKGFSKLIR